MRNYRENKGPTVKYQAVCSNCGKDCQVPFRPTGSKPVFCSKCFETNGGNDRRPSSVGNFQPRFNNEERPLYDVVCEKCGQQCQIPFQPRNGRPVFCNNCFRNSDGLESRGPAPERVSFERAPQNNVQLEAVNTKLDKIIELLTVLVTPEVKVAKEEEPVKKITKATKAVKATKKSA